MTNIFDKTLEFAILAAARAATDEAGRSTIPYEALKTTFLKRHPNITDDQFEAAFKQIPDDLIGVSEPDIFVKTAARKALDDDFIKVLDAMLQGPTQITEDGKIALSAMGSASLVTTKKLFEATPDDLTPEAKTAVTELARAALASGHVPSRVKNALATKSGVQPDF